MRLQDYPPYTLTWKLLGLVHNGAYEERNQPTLASELAPINPGKPMKQFYAKEANHPMA
ncbi:hypothetical protein [Vulcanisaeta sp. JCM 14467]